MHISKCSTSRTIALDLMLLNTWNTTQKSYGLFLWCFFGNLMDLTGYGCSVHILKFWFIVSVCFCCLCPIFENQCLPVRLKSHQLPSFSTDVHSSSQPLLPVTVWNLLTPAFHLPLIHLFSCHSFFDTQPYLR